MLIRVFILVMLALILASLFSALVLLFRRRDGGTAMVKALTWRIALSLTLFALLMAGFYFGVIPPQGLSSPAGH